MAQEPGQDGAECPIPTTPDEFLADDRYGNRWGIPAASIAALQPDPGCNQANGVSFSGTGLGTASFMPIDGIQFDRLVAEEQQNAIRPQYRIDATDDTTI